MDFLAILDFFYSIIMKEAVWFLELLVQVKNFNSALCLLSAISKDAMEIPIFLKGIFEKLSHIGHVMYVV